MTGERENPTAHAGAHQNQTKKEIMELEYSMTVILKNKETVKRKVRRSARVRRNMAKFQMVTHRLRRASGRAEYQDAEVEEL